MVLSDSGESSSPPILDIAPTDTRENKRQFDEFVAASTAELIQLLDKIRADAAEVERLKTEVATLKGNIEANQQAANTDLGIITQVKADVETIKSNSESLAAGVAEKVEATSKALAELCDQRDAISPLLTELTEIKAGSEAKRDGVNVLIEEIVATKAKFAELSSEIATAQKSVTKDQDSLKAKIAEIGESHKSISAFHQTLFEEEGVKAQVLQLQQLMSEVVEGTKTDRATFTRESAQQRKDLFSSLESRILALLPSAGAAGLAYTYYNAKSKYSPTSYAGAPGGTDLVGIRKQLRSFFGYNPASLVATVSFYLLFLAPLAVVAIGSFQLLQKLEADPHFVLTYQMLGLRLLVAAPLATISAFGFASLRLYRKLYEEYNHKQRVMELYESFKKEIDSAGSAEQKKMLLTIMLNSVASKASDFVKDDEKVDDSILSRVERWASAIVKLKGTV